MTIYSACATRRWMQLECQSSSLICADDTCSVLTAWRTPPTCLACRHQQCPNHTVTLHPCAAPMQTINETGLDTGLRSVYSNAVDAAHFKQLKHYAKNNLAFKHLAAKETASVHIKNMNLNTSLVVAFNCSGYTSHMLHTSSMSHH